MFLALSCALSHCKSVFYCTLLCTSNMNSTNSSTTSFPFQSSPNGTTSVIQNKTSHKTIKRSHSSPHLNRTSVIRHYGKKIRGAQFSSELLFSLFISNISRHTDDKWHTTYPPCHWPGVQCNDESHITSINWFRYSLSGTLTWKYIPSTLVAFRVGVNQLKGSIFSFSLPSQLKTLHFNINDFSGDFSLSQLPRSMCYVRGQQNALSGDLDLTELPPPIVELRLSQNNFSGSIALNSLPEHLEWLMLGSNFLEGSLCVDYLPKSLIWLELKRNHFSGVVHAHDLPNALVTFELQGNKITEVIGLDISKKRYCIVL